MNAAIAFVLTLCLYAGGALAADGDGCSGSAQAIFCMIVCDTKAGDGDCGIIDTGNLKYSAVSFIVEQDTGATAYTVQCQHRSTTTGDWTSLGNMSLAGGVSSLSLGPYRPHRFLRCSISGTTGPPTDLDVIAEFTK